jgi:hypothetical protein
VANTDPAAWETIELFVVDDIGAFERLLDSELNKSTIKKLPDGINGLQC